MVESREVGAVDYMNYLFTEERSKDAWESEADEFNIVARTIRHEEPRPRPFWTPAQYVARMDAAGVDKVFVASVRMFSNRYRKPIGGWWISPEMTYEAIKDFPNRLIGLGGYNPLRIQESLADIERAVIDYGFKGVYLHTYGYGLPVNDKRMYPCYALCERLGVPVSMQTGHSLEVMPSDPGRPIYLDDIALDFPNLNIVGAHTGWPWCEELIAMAWKHANVYFGCDAHMPRYWEPNVVHFVNSRGQDKVLFGTNGAEWGVYFGQIEALNLREEAKRKLLRENAMRIYKL